jgi:formate-dependent nitrite reductase cytochrome c552 subunit
LARAEAATVDAIRAIEAAAGAGADDQQLAASRKLHRQAQWRTDFVAAENSGGFHAPQEAARILGEAIDLARRSQLEALKPPGAKDAGLTEPASKPAIGRERESAPPASGDSQGP